jgi:hypothetical protein
VTRIRTRHRADVAAGPVLALLVGVCLLAGACSGDDDGAVESSPVATASRVAVTPGPDVTSAAPSPDTDNREVVGIVGAVNQADNRIEINRLSGADVEAVLVTSATRILSGQGRPLTLADLRPSDRIIAKGTVDGAELTADRVEIQAVLPGASPGG